MLELTKEKDTKAFAKEEMVTFFTHNIKEARKVFFIFLYICFLLVFFYEMILFHFIHLKPSKVRNE